MLNPSFPLLLAALVSATGSGLPNLDFSTGKLTHWEGQGFDLVPFGSSSVVSSADKNGKPHKALLHRTFTLPPHAVAVHFSAAALSADELLPSRGLEIVLEGANRSFAPRELRQGENWVPAPTLLPPQNRRLREYRFLVDRFAGRKVRLALIDSDDTPGNYLIATGFKILTQDDLNARQFLADIQKLQKTNGLGKMQRYDTRHFFALSNADAAYTEYRLHNCETLYPLFFAHFRKKGFSVRPPAEKMMVAIFNSQDEFEAYLGQKLGSSVTGLYHTPTNRLLVYDYASNRAFVEGKKRFDEVARAGVNDLDRERRTLILGRHVRDRRDDTNISTIMHEVAHQLSFNGGLFNRQGDVPVWLAEGLAVYCESTRKGAWQGIGEANPHRATVLARAINDKKDLLSIRDLVRNDDWIRKAHLVEQVVLGYSQSWALFRLLIEERPAQLKTYLQTIYPRKTPEHRFADFVSAFGSDLTRLERRYADFLREIARNEAEK